MQSGMEKRRYEVCEWEVHVCGCVECVWRVSGVCRGERTFGNLTYAVRSGVREPNRKCKYAYDQESMDPQELLNTRTYFWTFPY